MRRSVSRCREDDRTATHPILLVEDDPDRITLTKHALARKGVENEILVARDGVEALDLLVGEEAIALPALVLLDLKLPKLDGFEVLERIRSEPRTEHLPVVVLTSSTEDEDRLACYGLGANSFITKPVDFDAFTDAIGQIARYWLELNEGPP